MNRFCVTMGLCGLLLAAANAGFAQSFTLYDGTSGVTPDNATWGWNYLSTGGSATKTAVGGVTTLDSTASDGISAGFSTVTSGRSTPFVLNNAAGYTVGFDIQVNSENHSNANADKNADGLADRSGVSLIVLGSDHKGVEMAFWQDEIWTQQDSPLFIHNTVSERDQGAGLTNLLTHYNLTVQGSSYSLSNAGGTVLLTGSLRDYFGNGAPSLPYATPNFLFLGDDTTSANGSVGIGRVTVTLATPEPGVWTLLASGLIGTGLLWKRRKRHSPGKKA
ncbi:MAG: putative exosortase interaction protein [Chthonomonadaceae bacterium]|nr:putative exosortase interaction protein [Chthonomonadaceae bacterium]